MNTKKINICIIEDQQDNIDILRFFLKQYSDDIVIKYIGYTGSEARKLLVNKDIDLALLDIDLGEETIFDVLDSIEYSHLSDGLIFVTAHGTFENALKAIRFSCLNFITKPIDFEELAKTLTLVLSKSQNLEVNGIDALLEIIKTDISAPKKVGIPLTRGIIQYENCNNILYITADDIISRVYLNENETLTSVKNLGYFTKLFRGHKDFLQIHKSILINLNQITKFNARKRLVVMNNKEELTVSRRQIINLQNAMKS